jgi:hypothetical protein
MTNKQMPKNAEIYICETCDFKTSKHSNFASHNLTRKHQIRTNTNKNAAISNKEYICGCNKIFKHASSLWNHKQKCPIANKSHTDMKDTETIEDNSYKQMFFAIMNENKELRTMMQELIPKIGNTITNTNCNNKFNLHVYLNETCKDAMNIMDFVNSLNIQLSEVETFGSSGYVEGISKIFIRGLKELEETKRPIHCSDLKRETLYVKDNNTWEKENAERSKIKEAIKKIANKNVHRITDWTRANPTSLSDYNSKKHSQYMYILNKSMGACDPEENDKDYNKIIRKIANQVIIHKELE